MTCLRFLLPSMQQHEYREDYEATDVGSWSCVGSNVPVRNEPYIAQLV